VRQAAVIFRDLQQSSLQPTTWWWLLS
jgi:hypothetical protein